MATKEELLRVPAFADLPEDQIEWFLAHSEELLIKPGETYIEEGTPADAMFVLLEGQLHARGNLGGQNVVFTFDAGDVGGRLPFSPNEDIHLHWTCRFRKPRCTLSGDAVSRVGAADARSWPVGWSA